MTNETLIKAVLVLILVAYNDNYKKKMLNAQLNVTREIIKIETREMEMRNSMHVNTGTLKTSGSKRSVHAPQDVRVSNAVTSMRHIINRVENYTGRNGHWPESMNEIGLNSETSAHTHLQAIKIDDGEIYGFLKPEFGNNKMIRIHHTIDQTPYGWKCSTNLTLEGPTYLGGMTCEEDPSISFSGTYFQ